jgi:alpha-tubulin suppressor-like RCC1 family protein
MMKLHTRPQSAWLIVLIGLLAASAAACGEDASTSAAPLVGTLPVEAGTRCPAGGQQISIGFDQNGDGALQSDESVSSQVVCNGEAGAPGPDGFNIVSRTRTQAVSATCPSGGRVLETGLDLNSNQALDDEEVLNTNLLCNGDAGPSTLLRFTDEPSGANCSNGGKRFDYGADINNSGALDDDEISSTQYICNGGELATRLTSVDRGSSACPGGGIRVESGLDANDNGTLEDNEVARTEVACNRHITQVEAGLAHTCAMRNDGELYCWGSNALLQLGLTEEDLFPEAFTPTPRPFYKLTAVTQFDLGFGHTCASTAPDGELFCWGSNSNGQLGQDTSSTYPLGLVDAPTAVTLDDNGTPTPLAGVSSFSLGQFHTCAVVGDDDHALCWGSDSSGQLGSNRDGVVDLTIQSVTPSPVLFDDGSGADPAPLTDIRQVVTGDIHSCAVTNDDRVLCWGGNDTNQLASATAGTMRSVAVDIGFNNVLSLAAGDKHTCALRNDKTIWCWGRNNDGQLGISLTTTTSAAPVQVRDADGQPLANVIAITAGDRTSCAAVQDGSLYCWGVNSDGQLGAAPNVARSDKALLVTALNRVTHVSLGGNHGCAIRDGQLSCWGLNNDGQLGVGSTTDSRYPLIVPIDLAP